MIYDDYERRGHDLGTLESQDGSLGQAGFIAFED